jgi:hypothetical protein
MRLTIVFVVLLSSLPLLADSMKFINREGTVLFTGDFAWANPFSNGRALVFSNRTNKMAFIDTNGNITIDPIDGEFANFSENLAGFRGEHQIKFSQNITLSSPLLWGFIDTKGKVVIHPKFAAITPFSEGMSAVNINGNDEAEGGIQGGKWGFINKQGNLVIPAKYDYAWPYKNGIARVNIGGSDQGIHGGITGGNSFFINKSGQRVPDRIGAIRYNNNINLFPFNKNGLIGYISFDNKVMIHPIYSGGDPFQENGYARINVGGEEAPYGIYGGKYGFINTSGVTVIPASFDEAGYFSQEMSAVYKDGKCGYINTLGKVIINLVYGQCGDFSEGIASVK